MSAATTNGSGGSGEPLRVAFAGTAHVHVRDYVEACVGREDVRIVGACLVDADSPYRLPPDVPVVDAPDGLPPHDVCAVTTDIASHERVAAAMVARHVFVEKPLGTSAAAARRVAETLRRDGRTLHVGFFLRHEPALRTLGARLAARRIGRMREVRMTYEHDGLRRGWLADWPAHVDSERMGHGAFGDLAGHLIDLCGATLDPLRPVRCDLLRAPGAAVDVAGEALLLAPGGARVRIRAGAAASRTRLELCFEGERGALTLRDGVLRETLSGRTRALARRVEPTPLTGFLAMLDEVRGSGARRGATGDDAIAVNRTLDRLHARASIRHAPVATGRRG